MTVRILFLSLFLILLGLIPARSATAPAQIAWRLLDYIAVDYPGAVQDGRVISEMEFAEMTEFAQSAAERIAALAPSDAKADLQARAVTLQGLIAGKSPSATIALAARSLAADLLQSYPVPLAPMVAPHFDRGRELFQQNCASCHGENGDGQGSAGIGLDPPPIAFTDRERAQERSIFAFYQVIEQGIEDTSMASYATLPPQDRWDLALYASAFAYPESEAAQGEQIWKADESLRDGIDLKKLLGMTPASLAEKIGEDKAGAVTAYLRRNPAVVVGHSEGPLALTRTRLKEALVAYENGDRKAATDLALSAYLDGFEPIEPILATRDNPLMIRIEGAMGRVRAGIAKDRPIEEVQAQIHTLDGLFREAEAVLASGETSAGTSFFGAFTILLREGVEALLIVVTMLAFLRQTNRRDVLLYVHGGWIAALVAGGLTWILATYVISISGASRELTEGFGSVFAAFVLLWVGLWMHSKSSAEAWQRYICDKLNRALNKRSAWFLFGLSFLVVYREVFETILFYAAIWNHGNSVAVLAGGAVAVAVLCLIAWMLTHFSRALPIEKFFRYSSVLIAVLAVVLIGKGVAALQEGGYLSIHPLTDWPRITLLGIYPTLEGMVASLGMIVLLAVGFAWGHFRAKKIRLSKS